MNKIKSVGIPSDNRPLDFSHLPMPVISKTQVPAQPTANDLANPEYMAQQGMPNIHQEHYGNYQQAGNTIPGHFGPGNINVVTNHNLHLPFKDWMARGVVGGVGSVLAFPFKLVGDIISALANGILSLVKMAVMVVLFPTLLWMGYQLQQSMQEEESVEDGTAAIVDHAEDVVSGIGKGISQ